VGLFILILILHNLLEGMVKNLETFLDLLKIFLDTVKTASPLTCCKFKEKFKNCSKGSVRMSVTFGLTPHRAA